MALMVQSSLTLIFLKWQISKSPSSSSLLVPSFQTTSKSQLRRNIASAWQEVFAIIMQGSHTQVQDGKISILKSASSRKHNSAMVTRPVTLFFSLSFLAAAVEISFKESSRVLMAAAPVGSNSETPI